MTITKPSVREINALKDHEILKHRVRKVKWVEPTVDAQYRLECLIAYQPTLTNRQVFNLASTNEVML